MLKTRKSLLAYGFTGERNKGKKEVEKIRERCFERLPEPQGAGCRRASGGSSGTAVPPPRGRLHLAVSAVKLGKEGKAAFRPLCLLLDKKGILFPWKFSLEMRVSG